MNILHVIHDLLQSTGGPVTALMGMAEAQAALGHNVTILTTQLGKEEWPLLRGVAIHAYPCEFSGWRWSKGLARSLPGHVSKADIVHIHTVWEYPTWAASRVCRSLGVPYIIRPCGMLEQWSLSQNAIKKWLYLYAIGNSILRDATAIHFTSESERVNSNQVCAGCDEFVIPIGLNPAAYEESLSESDFYDRFPVLKGRKIVLFLGRLHYKKQPDVAIHAFGIACTGHPDACLVLAGPGEPEYVSQLKHLTQQLGIEQKVLFVGMLHEKAVREAYRAATLFVLPSLQENFGISVAEAMAAGCPVVVSDQVSLSSEVACANAGVVCPAEVEPTAEAIARLLGNSELRKTMGANGRNLILEKFTWERIVSDLTDVYGDILSGQHVHLAWRKGVCRKL
jgi:glycosyltransferase involved in cell wall biosynthesis